MTKKTQSVPTREALACAVAAARAAGKVMRDNLHAKKRIDATTPHDIKLELDVRCQKRIQKILRQSFPEVAILGEEGGLGDRHAPWRWVVDPIDGTVNFAHGIPHACVSIALQVAIAGPAGARAGRAAHARGGWAGYRSVVGVVHDPFCDEMWTAVQGSAARLNGRAIHVGDRRKLAESIVSVGFGSQRSELEKMHSTFNALIHQVRKIRIMGAAALGLTYVASGRMDAYVEYGLSLWDFAAGGLIVECAGGEFFHQPIAETGKYRIIASNRFLRKPLQRVG